MVQGFKSCQIVDERFDSCFTVFSCLGPSLRWFELGNDGFWSLDLLMFRGLGGCSLVLPGNQVDDVLGDVGWSSRMFAWFGFEEVVRRL